MRASRRLWSRLRVGRIALRLRGGRVARSVAAPMHTLGSCSLFLQRRPCSSSGPSTGGLEIEILSSSPQQQQSGETAHSTARQAQQPLEEETVRTLDIYARAGVSNFISRVTGGTAAVKKPPTSGGEAGPFDLTAREIEGSGGGGSVHYHVRQRLPVPAAYGERVAEGFGATEKEAETLAAMHAVRVLDALGIPVYQLSSKQKRHAEAARAAGRPAPRPGDPPAAPDTPSPPPLRYQAEGAVAVAERKLRVDQMEFATVTAGPFLPFQHTLASPYFLDHGSVRRLRQFFQAYDADMERYSSVVALHKAGGEGDRRRHRHPPRGTATSTATPAAPAAAEEPLLFLSQMRLPILPRFGDRVCMGKATTRKDAQTLACMHAELTIDALGLALYPADRERQLAHVEECRKVGRWCAAPGDLDYRYDVATPPPLQLSDAGGAAGAAASRSRPSGTPAAAAGGGRPSHDNSPAVPRGGPGPSPPSVSTAELSRGATTVESILVQHSRAVAAIHRVVDVAHLDGSAQLLLDAYLLQRQEPLDAAPQAASSLFFAEVLGIKFHETYRATVTVPLRFPHGGEDSFVAIGISSESKEEAELAAATHAVRLLAELNHRIAFTDEARALLSSFANSAEAGAGLPEYDPSRPAQRPDAMAAASGPAAALVLPVRCVSETHLGRILSPGLTGNKEHHQYREHLQERQQHIAEGRRPPAYVPARAPSSSGPAPVRLQEEQLTQAILANQRKLPRAAWSLAEDAGQRIIVDPAAAASTGQNYVHTLPAVRTPDVFAVNRLRDYLERHGKQLAASVAHSCEDAGEGDPDADEEKKLAHGAPPARLRLHTATCVLPTRVRCAAAAASVPDTADSTAAPHHHLVARGEAYGGPEDALLMCAMHAELLLDAFGIPMYDHPELQRRHADTARMLGRWAPLAAGAMAPAALAAVPPPVRKEHEQSCLWARLQMGQQRDRARQAPLQAGAAVGGTASPVGAASPPLLSNLSATAATPSDEVLCGLSQLRAIHHSEIFRTAVRHVQVYYRGRGSDFFRSLRQYTAPSEQHGRVHRAVAELPLPPQFGRRFAVGCAASKKRALALCATHAAWTLEALAVPIYTGTRQLAYAKEAELRGRAAPKPGDPLQPGDTPSPRGVCCFVGGSPAAERPDPPVEPTAAEIAGDNRVWPVYTRACRTFIDKALEADLHEAVAELSQAPRCGIDVEDDALDIVERAPLNKHARHQLLAACARYGLPTPSLPFRYEPRGRGPAKRFLAEAPVLGTPYVARGLGKAPAESLTRTAMHYEYLVTQIVARNGPVAGGGGGGSGEVSSSSLPQSAATPGKSGLFDATWGGFTVAGEEAVIALYAASHPPCQPMVVMVAEAAVRSGSSSASPPAVPLLVATARLDEGGGGASSVQASSRPLEAPADAVDDAIRRLFALLQGRPQLQAVTHFVRKHPNLRTGAIAIIAGGDADCDNSTAMGTTTSTGPRPPRPSHEVMEELAGGGGAGDAPAVVDPAAGGFLSSHLAELLIEAAGRHLGATSAPSPLTLSAAAREALPLMGLLQRSRAGQQSAASAGQQSAAAADGQESWHVTPAGVAAAYLVRCLPSPHEYLPQAGSALRAVAGPLLPLQLARMVLTGLMLAGDGGPTRTAAFLAAVCRVTALVACGPAWVAAPHGASCAEWDQWASPDLISYAVDSLSGAGPPASRAVVSYEQALTGRLASLAAAFAESDAAQSQLGKLLAHAAAPSPEGAASPLPAESVARLRLCLSCATFPTLMTALPGGITAIVAGTGAVAILESADGLRTALTRLPGPATPLSFAAFDAALVLAPDTPAAALQHRPVRPAKALHQHHGHVWAMGAPASPLGSLLASASGCNEAAVLTCDDADADRLLLFYEGTAAVPLPSVRAVRRLQSLQHHTAPMWGALQPFGEPAVSELAQLAAAPAAWARHYHEEYALGCTAGDDAATALRQYMDKLREQ